MDLGLWDPAQIWQLQLIIWSIKVWCRQSVSTEAVTQEDGVWLDRIFFFLLLNAQHHTRANDIKRYYLEIFRPNSRYVLHSGGISLCALPLTSTQVFGRLRWNFGDSTVLGASKQNNFDFTNRHSTAERAAVNDAFSEARSRRCHRYKRIRPSPTGWECCSWECCTADPCWSRGFMTARNQGPLALYWLDVASAPNRNSFMMLHVIAVWVGAKYH